MILNSLELNTTHQSKETVEELVSALTKEIEAQSETEKKLHQPRFKLGKTYLKILEAGGHLGC
ncbi:MAG: hypothetical protein EA000_16645 [Oscillatoriales cyanobacterium]|nr:MAG: hypothetical protein EA000_16645 [Oscillatoriales cyanobacterium]TAE05948.1 MAG: hypothetical protein EAZ96_03685 [Oscillatoriales cyanobacterium]TAF46710.1 MAG: hypothetical protein EAZ68_03395 [Oscillatoriales cyanobacterium]TAF63145.1 MAG: hypothetical protein EAZ59_21410 [Oscillatoriales cyanobacterium]